MSAPLDRRQFLTRTALGAAAGLALPLTPAFRPRRPDRRRGPADPGGAGRDVRVAAAVGGRPQRRLA